MSAEKLLSSSWGQDIAQVNQKEILNREQAIIWMVNNPGKIIKDPKLREICYKNGCFFTIWQIRMHLMISSFQEGDYIIE